MKIGKFLFGVSVAILLFPCVGLAGNGNDSITIMTYNVRNCKGLDETIDYGRVADVISRFHPDFVALQELDSAAVRSAQKVVLNELAAHTQMIPTYRASIKFQGGKYGIGMLTREKPVLVESISLPGREELRSLLVVETSKYVVCCTHFSLTAADRLASVAIIDSIAAKYNKPVFLAGDFNMSPNSQEMKALLRNWELLSNAQQPTFPADQPNECIDFIFRRKNMKVVVTVQKAEVVKEPLASDHRPVYVDLIVSEP